MTVRTGARPPNPANSALVLVIVVAAWAFVSGFAELFAAFQSGETAGTRAFFIRRQSVPAPP